MFMTKNGEVNDSLGTSGRLWRNGKCAAMAVHDLSRHCESKPRAFAIRLRGEKWLQRSVDVFGGNARALIGHAEKQHFCIGGERHLDRCAGR